MQFKFYARRVLNKNRTRKGKSCVVKSALEKLRKDKICVKVFLKS